MSPPEKKTIALAKEELKILDAMRRHSPSHRLGAKLAEVYGVWTVCFRRYCEYEGLPWLWMTSVSKFMDYLDAHPKVSSAERDRALDGIMFYLSDIRKDEEEEPESAEGQPPVPESTQSLFAQLLLQCDIRLTEALRLRLKDVRLDDEVVALPCEAQRGSRTVPLPSPLRKGFEKHVRRVEERSSESNPLLFGHRGIPKEGSADEEDSSSKGPLPADDLRRSTEVATGVMKTFDPSKTDE